MRRLADIAEIYSGVAPSRDVWGGARFLQIGDLRADDPDPIRGRPPSVARAQTVEEGDVLVAARGDPAPVVVATPEMLGAYVTPDIYLVRPHGGPATAPFLAAYLRQPQTQAKLQAATAGSVLPRIPKPALDALEVPLPSLEHQRAISELASLFDVRVRQLEQRIKLERTLHTAAMAKLFNDQ